MRARRRGRPRRALGTAGMTLTEVLVAMIITLVLAQVAFTFFTSQGRAFERGTRRMALLQNHRFAMEELERNLRALGSGVPFAQPDLVYAGEDVVAFNANFISTDALDPFAVYIDRRAPPEVADALSHLAPVRIPTTSYVYPDTTYQESGTNSPAETIILYFSPDSLTARADDFVLYRQVNGAAPAVVARNILRTPGTSFFEYLQLATSDTAPARLQAVERSRLPFAHTARLHASAADTAESALTDSIRAVRVSFTVTNGDRAPRETLRQVTRVIRLPNAGQQHHKTCGESPQLGTGLGTEVVTLAGGKKAVRLTWYAATDERGGEADVLRYLLWRRTDLAADWGSSFLSIPSGATAYQYLDEDAPAAATVQYALAAQDCTPSLSSLAASAVHDTR